MVAQTGRTGKRVDLKGVCYDTGRAYGSGFVTRRVFDPAMTRRALARSTSPCAGATRRNPDR